jgi:hypothetical protein
MFEVSLVVRARGQQYDARIVASGKINERVALGTEEGSETQYVGNAKDIRQNIGDNGPILQCIAAA